MAVASTVVLLRVFADRDWLHTQAGALAMGWLLVEDLAIVLVVLLLPLFAGGGGSALALVGAIGLALLKLGALAAIVLVGGGRLVPALLTWVARTRSRELFTLAVLALALGVAVGAAELFGASMALGAFLAGLVVGRSDFGARAAADAMPMRDAFAVLFFVATGMLLDPSTLWHQLPLIGAALAAVLLVKPLIAVACVRLAGYPALTAWRVGSGLAQLGEFSFVVATLGVQLGVLPRVAAQVLIATSMVTIALNPLLTGLVDRWAGAGRRALAEPAPLEHGSEPTERVIVVGYGPAGRVLVELLRDGGLSPLVVDLNYDSIRELQARGLDALHGDAAQAEILERAGVATARALVCSASAPSEPILRLAKALNPQLPIVARARFISEAAPLLAAGASEVLVSEREVAVALVDRLLALLGATPEQLDRARDRARSALLPEPHAAPTAPEAVGGRAS